MYNTYYNVKYAFDILVAPMIYYALFYAGQEIFRHLNSRGYSGPGDLPITSCFVVYWLIISLAFAIYIYTNIRTLCRNVEISYAYVAPMVLYGFVCMVMIVGMFYYIASYVISLCY